MSYTRSLVSLVLLTAPKILSAQATPLATLPPTTAERSAFVNGWDRYLSLALNGTMVQNQNVIGKDPGQTTTVGFKLAGNLDHETALALWQNSLTLASAYSRTPVLGTYVKSDDQLKAESLYKRRFFAQSRYGSFARVQLESSLFRGYSTQAEPRSFIIQRADGREETQTSERLLLTDPFRPLKLTESLGVFANLIDTPALNLDVKAGLGLRQVFAQGQLTADDVEETAALELKELSNYRYAGYEFGSQLGGASADKRVSYQLTATVLFPILTSANDSETERSDFDRRIMDLSGQVSFHLLSWASLDYLATALRDPQLTANTQITQSFLFSAQHVFAERQTP